jgi:hypothetical protein
MGDVGKPVFEAVGEQARILLIDAYRNWAWQRIAGGHIGWARPYFRHGCMGGKNLEILRVVNGECLEGPIRRLLIAQRCE